MLIKGKTGIFIGTGRCASHQGLVIDVAVKQALLRSVLPDGTVVLLVVLHDERCAILRDKDVVLMAQGDAEGIDGAVQQFMQMTQVSDVLDPAAGGGRANAGETDASGAASPPDAPPAPTTVPPPAPASSSPAPGTGPGDFR